MKNKITVESTASVIPVGEMKNGDLAFIDECDDDEFIGNLIMATGEFIDDRRIYADLTDGDLWWLRPDNDQIKVLPLSKGDVVKVQVGVGEGE